MWTALLAATILLPSCVSTASSIRLEVYCPQIEAYDRAFSEKLADEVEQLPSDSTIVEALSDYVELRGKIRACVEERDKL